MKMFSLDRENWLGKIFGFSTKTSISENVFSKTYIGASQEFLDRIVKYSQILSDNNICPKFLGVTGNTCSYQRVTPFFCLDMDDMKDAEKQITEQVVKLHELGFGHGDLCLNNIGYWDGQYYLLDLDTVYNVEADGKSEWLFEIMKQGFDMDNIEDFQNHDLDNWKYELEEQMENFKGEILLDHLLM